MKYTTYLFCVGAAHAQNSTLTTGNLTTAADSDYNTASGDMNSALNDASGPSSSNNYTWSMTVDGSNA